MILKALLENRLTCAENRRVYVQGEEIVITFVERLLKQLLNMSLS